MIVTFFLGVAEDAPNGECELYRVWDCEIATGRAAASGMGEYVDLNEC